MKKNCLIKGVAVLVLAGMLLGGCGSMMDGDGMERMSGVESEGAMESQDMGVASLASEAVSTPAPKEDWSGKYDHYFEDHPITNTIMSVEYVDQGVKTKIKFYLGKTEEMLFVKYVVWCCKDEEVLNDSQERNYSRAYFMSSGDCYMETVIKGDRKEYYRTSGIAMEAADDMATAENPLEMDDDTFENLEYDGEETIDGVLYDVLHSKTIRKTKSKANRWVHSYFYINRETQELVLLRVKDSTKTVECYFEPLNEEDFVTIPEELLNAKKIKSEEYGTRYVVCLLRITLSAMGLEPDDYIK